MLFATITYSNLANSRQALLNDLRSEYFNLYNQYQSLEYNYSALQDKYNQLQNQLSSAQSNANYWQSQYYTLQSQYSNLQNKYNSAENQLNSLINQYNSLLNLLGSCSWSGPLGPHYSYFCYIFVPSGYGILHISVSASAPVDVYVFNPDQYACYLASLVSESCPIYVQQNYEYYVYGTNINGEVTLSGGHYVGEYIFVVANNNNAPVQVSISINTTYVLSS
jgi:chaperonin cofactor prefoldin